MSFKLNHAFKSKAKRIENNSIQTGKYPVNNTGGYMTDPSARGKRFENFISHINRLESTSLRHLNISYIILNTREGGLYY
jgi:hypothetical protein